MRSGLKVLALVLVAGTAAYVLVRPGFREPRQETEGDIRARLESPAGPPPSASPSSQAGGVSAPPAPPTAPATPASRPTPAARGGDVVAIETLRDLLNSQPLRAIELARQANQRAPESPDAPERAWIIVKALAGLGRFHEARDEAADLVSKHPDTSWAMDAKRHMLVQPLDLPSREEQQRAQQQEQQRRDQGR